MAEKRNYLLGKGERLTEPVLPAGRKLDKVPPYTYAEARARLAPMIDGAIVRMAELPEAARPGGQVVGGIILNPEYIAKSYYPEQVLKTYGLKAVGSKPVLVTPEKRSLDRPPIERPSTELFVAGALSGFRRLLADIESVSVAEAVQSELPALEQFEAIDPKSKIKGKFTGTETVPVEIVLHASEFRQDYFIIDAFQNYLQQLELRADLDHRFHAGGLCFLRMRAPLNLLSEVAKFSFLRAVREMPRLRILDPLRSVDTTTEIDSAHPGSYTRSGLEIVFRPNAANFDEGAMHPKTATFFSQSKLYETEDVLRADAHKWETCLHGKVRKRGSSLQRPVFDIHYLARDEGRAEHMNVKIKYALVITVEAPRHQDLYNIIVRKYRNILEPMVPIQIPIQV